MLETQRGVTVVSAHGHHAASLLASCAAGVRRAAAAKSAVCVLKLHEYSVELRARATSVFVSHRDLRDALLSSAEMFGSCLGSNAYARSRRAQPEFAAAFAQYERWASAADYLMPYERMVSPPSSSSP